MNDGPDNDFPRLRRAILLVVEAAKAESQAMRAVASSRTDETMQMLRETHMNELDAVQALAAALELYDRRLTRNGRISP